MKKRIYALSLFPIVVMSIVIMILTMTVIKTNIEEDTETNLRGIACAVNSMYEQNSGDYM